MSANTRRKMRPSHSATEKTHTVDPYLLVADGVLQNRLSTLDVTVQSLGDDAIKLEIKDMWSSQSAILTAVEAEHVARLLKRTPLPKV